MQVGKSTVKKFIGQNDIVFVIPVYQRNYDWKKQQCLQLVNDIESLIGNDNTHFIGTMCYKMSGRYNPVIIDGQQRITTITLLFKALFDCCDNENLKRKIERQFLFNPDSKDDFKLKLKPIKKDEVVYKKILTNDELNDEEKDSNIYINYSFYCAWISNKLKSVSAEKIEDAIERLEIVEIVLENENPQIIFESLNSTGLGLTNTDLIRNYLLMSLPYSEQETLYNNYWLKIEDMIGTDNMEDFMVSYLVMKRKSVATIEEGKKANISSRNLYANFKKEFPNLAEIGIIENIEEYFKDLKEFASIYKHFIYDDKTEYSKLSAIDQKLYELFYILESKSASVLLMWIYKEYLTNTIDEKTILAIIETCISLSFRAKVCRYTGFSNQFSALTLQKIGEENNNNFLDIFQKAICSGKGKYSFPTDVSFRSSLITEDIYNSLRSDKTKYLLYKIEKSLEHSKEIPPYETGSIEHVMPQKIDKWIEKLKRNGEEETYLNFIHNLGNLTLTAYNSEVSNNCYEDKVKEYAKSNYTLTKEITAYSDWGIKEIQKRGEQLADRAVKIWPSPDANKEVVEEETYDLTYDYDYFTSTKPRKVYVLDEEKEIASWKDFLIFVCRKFYVFDSENFTKLFNKNKEIFNRTVLSKNQKDLRSPAEIFYQMYCETNLSSADILKTINSIVKYFEEIYDSNISDQIWFQLR